MLRADNLTGMRTAFILHPDQKLSRDTSDQAIAAALKDPKAMFWLDIILPDDADLKLLDEVFGFHPLAIEDSVEYTQRPKIERYQHTRDHRPGHEFAASPSTEVGAGGGAAGGASGGAGTDAANGNGYFYMVFHGPDVDTFRQNLRTKEIDMFVSYRYLVSIHDEPMHSVSECHQKAVEDSRDWVGRGID